MAFIASFLLAKMTVPTISLESAGFLTVTLSELDDSFTVRGEKDHLWSLKFFLEDSISEISLLFLMFQPLELTRLGK